MLSELIALLGAVLFALGAVSIRRGLLESNFLSASMIFNLIGTIVFCILFLLVVPLNSVNQKGILFFALAGLFIPGFTALVYFKSMEKLGASTNSSIFAAYPLFGALLSVLMLGERPTLGIWVGIICTISGIMLIGRSVRSTSVKSTSPRITLALPLSAALLNGFGFVLRKMGLNAYNEPIAGVAISFLSSLCLYILLSILSTTVRSSMLVSRRSLKLFWKPVLFICAGNLCAYYALRYGEVSLITPLMNIEPFFVFIFAYVLLKELEKITYKLIIGTLIIITGVSLITIF